MLWRGGDCVRLNPAVRMRCPVGDRTAEWLAPKGQPNVAQANGLRTKVAAPNQDSGHHIQPSPERAA